MSVILSCLTTARLLRTTGFPEYETVLTHHPRNNNTDLSHLPRAPALEDHRRH
jgi:hypothetical protein